MVVSLSLGGIWMYEEKVLHCLLLLVGHWINCCHIYYYIVHRLSFFLLPSSISHPFFLLFRSLPLYWLRGLEEQQINYFCWFTAEKDWDDIKFGVDNKVDFYAVSFVKDAQVVHELKNYLQSKLQFPSNSFFIKY